MAHPDWVLKQRTVGTEIKFINKNYYLYKIKSKWSKEKKRAQKVTVKLIGKITPEGIVSTEEKKESKRAQRCGY